MATLKISKVNKVTGKLEKERVKVPKVIKSVIYAPKAESTDSAAAPELEGRDKYNPLYQEPKKIPVAVIDETNTSEYHIKSKQEIRMICDNFYQAQRFRIATENQARAVAQEADTGELAEFAEDVDWLDEAMFKFPAMRALVESRQASEDEIAKLVNAYVETLPVGKWLTANIGVGPLIAGSLMSYLDIEKAQYAGQFWSYCGYNDNNDPWLNSKQITYIMNNIVGDNEITDDIICKISAYCGRKATRIRNGSQDENGKITKTALRSYLAKPPFNRNLKLVCWKLGESFCKSQNREGSVYGNLFKERSLYEKTNNEELKYIQEALKALGYIERKNTDLTHAEELALLKQCQEEIKAGTFTPAIGKNTVAYKSYIEGKLPKGHIFARCKRWVVKLFLSHLHTAMYIDRYGVEPPMPYTIAVAGHADYIDPEVPFDIIPFLKGMVDSGVDISKLDVKNLTK